MAGFLWTFKLAAGEGLFVFLSLTVAGNRMSLRTGTGCGPRLWAVVFLEAPLPILSTCLSIMTGIMAPFPPPHGVLGWFLCLFFLFPACLLLATLFPTDPRFRETDRPVLPQPPPETQTEEEAQPDRNP